MIANIMAKLRSRIKFATDIRVSILCDDLATLLDIVEAVSAREPVDWYGERACLYCRVNIGDGDEHDPNCPYLRAREICGMDGDE